MVAKKYMSRIGDAPILIPAGVTVEKVSKTLMISGTKGNLNLEIKPNINVDINEGKITVKRKGDEKSIKAMHGLVRSLIANMVVGVTTGWSKDLELVGVGFRAQVTGNNLILNVGYSHPVEIAAPQGINFEVLDNTKIKVSGIDKYLVGQIAADIKKVRKPDVYKGKGVRYAGEYIRKKVGKSGKVGVAAASGGAK